MTRDEKTIHRPDKITLELTGSEAWVTRMKLKSGQYVSRQQP